VLSAPGRWKEPRRQDTDVLIENEFEVPAPIDQVWQYVLDVERVAPCMPGGELTEVVDERTWKGRVTMKLGPVSLAFAGTVTMTERDDETHRVVLKASGMEQRGKGAATALVTSWLEPSAEGTRVRISQDITISGPVAQYSRGMMGDVSARLTRQFADCLKANMEAEGVAAPATEAGPTEAGGEERGNPGPPTARRPAVTAKPVRGIRLALWALFRAIGRFLGRLFGRRPT
jgi:uncharacterized protein